MTNSPQYERYPDQQRTPPIPQPGSEDAAANDSGGRTNSGSGRKTRKRSVYQFPAYGFSMALQIAREVEESGGGTLTEETLAVNLGLSRTSSGFRLKCLAARHFGLLIKQGGSVSTTSVAKAILKPTSDDDALRGYQQSFLSIPLFQAVAERYRGQRLPDSQTLRNVLEREFLVEPKRVQQAERMLLDSARDTFLLQHHNDVAYLNVSDRPQWSEEEAGTYSDYELPWGPGSPSLPEIAERVPRSLPAAASVNTFSFSLDEVAQLSHEDFEQVWRAVGILVRARGARLRSSAEADGDASPQ